MAEADGNLLCKGAAFTFGVASDLAVPPAKDNTGEWPYTQAVFHPSVPVANSFNLMWLIGAANRSKQVWGCPTGVPTCVGRQAVSPGSPGPHQQHRALAVAGSALPHVLKWICGSVLLCLVQPDSLRRVRDFPTLDVHSAFCGTGPLHQESCRSGSMHRTFKQWPEKSLPSPLPPQLLNLFKLEERGEEVRPFGEVT